MTFSDTNSSGSDSTVSVSVKILQSSTPQTKIYAGTKLSVQNTKLITVIQNGENLLLLIPKLAHWP